MRIIVTGNLGYLGPVVGAHLRRSFGPSLSLIGLDTGYFSHCLIGATHDPDAAYDMQIRCDLRNYDVDILRGVDYVVHLAAISNDPMGALVARQTREINGAASASFLTEARAAGVRGVVFASSCSVYGAAEDGAARDEEGQLSPLSVYAETKIETEELLRSLATDRFAGTALRFATACGMSPRLRLDLVVNDFVAAALSTGKISILSDGTPWRPMIHVADMARAVEWGIRRTLTEGPLAAPFLTVNVGRTEWNYQVREIAERVGVAIPGTVIYINPNAQPDRRSYRVSFDRYHTLAPDYLPNVDLDATIEELIVGLRRAGFADHNFRSSEMIRLESLRRHMDSQRLDEDLRWINRHGLC